MNIVIHDYAGHPFQAGLSVELARRGHRVTHIYFADNPGPKGAFQERPDCPSLRFVGVSLGDNFGQSALLKRRQSDVEYGRRVGAILRDIKPDVVLSGNTPTESQGAILRASKASGARFVMWVQDVYSVAVSQLLSKRLGAVGRMIGAYYQLLDQQQYQQSNAIVVITEDFRDLAARWSKRPDKVVVIQNWASLADIPVLPRETEWRNRNNLNGNFVYLYSGTLGRKHNPHLLRALAQNYDDAAVVCVAGQGAGYDQLVQRPPPQLRLFPVQPAGSFAGVLGSADVLLATIEEEAGVFAVPSKVLSYMCAGRPILLSAPDANLAAKIVKEAEAGIVVPTGDPQAFLRAAARLRSDDDLRERLGRNARRYAEATFNIARITDRFEDILR